MINLHKRLRQIARICRKERPSVKVYQDNQIAKKKFMIGKNI